MQRVSRSLWLGALSLAEAAGIAMVACVYAAADRGLVGSPAAAVLLAGAFEGLCLGSAQAAGLRRLGARAMPWIGLTILGAVLGYGLSLLGMGGDEAAGAGTDSGPPLWLIALGGAGIGLGMGAVMGLVQSPALPGRIGTRAWVIANVIGWIPAMAAIMLAASLAERSWSFVQVAGLGALSGAVAGLCVAFATWPVVKRGAT